VSQNICLHAGYVALREIGAVNLDCDCSRCTTGAVVCVTTCLTGSNKNVCA
jgi:hypothetical protein